VKRYHILSYFFDRIEFATPEAMRKDKMRPALRAEPHFLSTCFQYFAVRLLSC